MSEFLSAAPSTPTKRTNLSTPSTGDTVINESPYDREQQVDWELEQRKKRRRTVMPDTSDENPLEATVIADRYSRPIFTKENGVLVEVTTQTENSGPYFYENGDPVLKEDIVKGIILLRDFNRVKRSRTNDGKSRKNKRKTVKRRKTGKSKRKNKSAHKKRH